MNKDKIKQIKPLAKAFFKYPNLYRHPVMFAKALIDYNNIKKDGGELDQLYSELPYKPNGEQKSDIRHPYTNAIYIQNGYPEEFVRDLGNYKEDADQIDNKPMDDTIGDLKNNQFGINLGLRYPDAPKTFIFDNVLQHAGLPVPARNNTLYGYIDNLPDTKEDFEQLNKQNESQLYRYLINPVEKYQNE